MTRRAIGTFLMVCGGFAIAWTVSQWASAWVVQRQTANALAEARVLLPCPDSSAIAENPSPAAARFEGARIAIARIDLDALVLPGDDAENLRLGVARIAGTAQFDEIGNVGLAAHRDTFFRPLRNVAVGDTIDVETATADWRYVVEWTRIVEPDAVDVLDPTTDRALTLVTCYPFNYIGSAPQRFIVRARGVPLTES